MPAKPSTIAALSTVPGRSGVAVIRISGPDTAEALRAMTKNLPEPRLAALKTLRDPQTRDALDKGLVIWFPAPASFTGEDMGELHIHGGRAVIQSVLDSLLKLKALRLAEPGEFARRAFENGKLDLTAAEGLADLIDAETEAQRRQALRQSEGALTALYEDWRERLIHVLALTEAALDFSDEADVPGETAAEARPLVEQLADEIADHLDDRHRGEILRDGFRVVIAGPPNAGKSSLLNILAKRDAAIVSEEAGTTRDVISVHLDLDGFPVIVMDTAGIRESRGKVEQEGIRRALHQASDADLILWLIDAKDPVWDLPQDFAAHGEKTLRVVNKIDLHHNTGGLVSLQISARTGQGISELTAILLDQVRARIGDIEEPMVTRARYRTMLVNCHDSLKSYLNGDPNDSELRAEDLRSAAFSLGRITGRVDVEDILDRVFANFCIGK